MEQEKYFKILQNKVIIYKREKYALDNIRTFRVGMENSDIDIIYGNELEKQLILDLLKTEEDKKREAIISAIVSIKQPRINSIADEIMYIGSNFINQFMKDNEISILRAKLEKEEAKSRMSGLKSECDKLKLVKQIVEPGCKVYKVADEEEKSKLEKLKEMHRNLNEIDARINRLIEEKAEFIEKYRDIKSVIDEIAQAKNQDRQTDMRAENMQSRKQEENTAKSQSIRPLISKKEAVKAVTNNENYFDDETICTIAGFQIVSKESSEDRKIGTENEEYNEENNRKINMVIGRKAKLTIGNWAGRVPKRVIKKGMYLSTNGVIDILNNYDIKLTNKGNEYLSKVRYEELLDPTIIYAISKSKASYEDKQYAIKKYLNKCFGHKERSIRLVYDKTDLSKTNILNRIFMRTEITSDEKEEILRRAEVGKEHEIVSIRGKFMPTRISKLFSRNSRKVKEKPAIRNNKPKKRVLEEYLFEVAEDVESQNNISKIIEVPQRKDNVKEMERDVG